MGLSNADTTTKIVGDKNGTSDVERQMYPILAGIYSMNLIQLITKHSIQYG